MSEDGKIGTEWTGRSGGRPWWAEVLIVAGMVGVLTLLWLTLWLPTR